MKAPQVMNHQMTTVKLFAALAAMLVAGSGQAATIAFSSLETILAAPDDMDSKMTALWTGWSTQQLEYNMPYIELVNEADAPSAISTFTITIGDEDYQFSNIFAGKANTNSFPYPANGEYALTGFSTPDVQFTTSVEEDGNVLVVDFGQDGLAPGEVVRFQVDIDRDPGVDGVKMYADYLSVFSTPNGGDDTSGNSEITITYLDPDLLAQFTVPNWEVESGVMNYLNSPRPYSTMQTPFVTPDGGMDPVPEPTGALLAALALGLVGAGRRG